MSTTAVIKQAYNLRHSVDHLNELSHDYDAYIVEWPEYLDYGLKFKQPNEFEYPSHGVKFQGYESCLSLTEYPFNDVSWPIMSRRMLNTLLKVREFPHRTWDIPIVGVPDNTPVKKLEKGLGGGISHDNEFVAVQLLEQLDIFDWENSIYKNSPINAKWVRDIRNLALHEPETGLPPIFRLTVAPTYLYVSPEGRAALEAAKIKGIRCN
jgi:hypothetical protein